MAVDDVPRRRWGLTRGRLFPRWPRRHRVWKRFAVAAAVVGYAWADGMAQPFTRASFIGVLIPGLVIAALAWLWPPRRISPPEKLDITGVSYWLIAVAGLFEWEASAFADNSLPWHPSLTDLINPLLGPHAIKSVAILLWMLVGWELVRR